MISSLFISFREGLEAALIIAIILAYLYQSGNKAVAKYAYIGAGLGIIVSLVAGFFSFREAQKLGEKSEGIFEGIMMLAASGLILYFIVWMGNQSGNISANIKNKVSNNTSAAGLFILSFLSVFREGMELVIFTLGKINQKASDVAIGSVVGILLAVLLTYIIFKSSIKLNLKIVFKILGLILIYIGAEMFAEGILKFIKFKEEVMEMILLAVFIIPSLYIFLKNDFMKLMKKENKR
jgi:high-affinity iron transporter